MITYWKRRSSRYKWKLYRVCLSVCVGAWLCVQLTNNFCSLSIRPRGEPKISVSSSSSGSNRRSADGSSSPRPPTDRGNSESMLDCETNRLFMESRRIERTVVQLSQFLSHWPSLSVIKAPRYHRGKISYPVPEQE